MKTINKTTLNLSSKLATIKASRMSTVSITDKSVSNIAIDTIPVGEVKALTLFDGSDDATGEEYFQAVITTCDNVNYSTCSKSAVDIVSDLISSVNDGDVNIAEIGFTFAKGKTKNGNNYLNVELI